MKLIHRCDDGFILMCNNGLILVLWLCGWAVFECILWATMFGADIRWAGGEVPPLWSLIIFTAFWTSMGVWAILSLIRLWRNRN